MGTTWQQVFALDAKYNANRAPNHPNFRTLYIRRRNQLLKQSLQHSQVCPDRKQYLKLRSFLLMRRYGVGFDQMSMKSRSISSINKAGDSCDIQSPEKTATDTCGLIPTRDAGASRALVGDTSVSENYAFAGVHHIFDQHTDVVSVVKFAHNDRSRLLCASDDGCVSICDVSSQPPCVLQMLRGHTQPVTGCDWSAANDVVVSGSLDGTLRVWDANNGTCVRVLVNPGTRARVLTCIFQPANNNMVIVEALPSKSLKRYKLIYNIYLAMKSGNSLGIVSTVNISTGLYPKQGMAKVGGLVLSLACDASGNIVWAGTSDGAVTSLIVKSWRLIKQRRVMVSPGHSITCLSWRQWASREARDPSLLINCANDVVCVFRVIDQEGSIIVKKTFPIRHKLHLVRSTFCPIMSFREGACIVSGSEDSCVYFIDVEKSQKCIVNKLQGHACPVLGVSFNYDESLLATSDTQGLIIVWKREGAGTD